MHSGYRGETWLYAGTVHHNADNQGKWMIPEQKVDMIVRLWGLEWEIFLGEISPLSACTFSDKAQSDHIKLMIEMKDALDWLFSGLLCGAKAKEMERVFVMGMQVVGRYYIIILYYWCICKIY